MSVEQPKQFWYEKLTRSLFRTLHKTNKRSDGYVPFFFWLALLFGGIWFPAGPVLKHVFENGDAPVGLLFGTAEVKTLTPQSSEGGLLTFFFGNNIEPAKKPQMPPYLAAAYVPLSFFFWSWSNIALLCVMASAMGEVNRHSEEKREGYPDYRAACTRAFFVYLFVLLNEIAIVGTLTPQVQLQGGYSRIAILASLFAFVASYRPTFYQGMISTISAMGQNANNQQDTPGNNEATQPLRQPGNLIAANEPTGDVFRPADDDFASLDVGRQPVVVHGPVDTNTDQDEPSVN